MVAQIVQFCLAFGESVMRRLPIFNKADLARCAPAFASTVCDLTWDTFRPRVTPRGVHLGVCRLRLVDLRTNSGSRGGLLTTYVRTTKTASAPPRYGSCLDLIPDNPHDALDRIHRHSGVTKLAQLGSHPCSRRVLPGGKAGQDGVVNALVDH